MTTLSQTKPEFFSTPALGIVEKVIAPNQPGRVKYQASYWPAKLDQTAAATAIESNQSVLVIGRQGITLLVRPY
jgi:membrane protein implicated in regulation of membrane protease activity